MDSKDISNFNQGEALLSDNQIDEENEPNQEVVLSKPEVFNCGICYEDYKPGEVELKMLDQCNHTFCADCFQETYRALIEDQSKHHMLKCP